VCRGVGWLRIVRIVRIVVRLRAGSWVIYVIRLRHLLEGSGKTIDGV
jgi:hypothetical protein